METNAGKRVLMLLENNPYPQDIRVRNEARTLVAAGYQVSVICPIGSGQPWREALDGVHVYRFPLPRGANGLLGYLLEYSASMTAMSFLSLAVLLREGFDFVHAHNPPDTLAALAAFYKVLGKRFVYDHHDLAPELYYARFRGKGNRLVYRALTLFERMSCQLADHVIAVNLSHKMVEIQRDKVPEGRITIVRNGPDVRGMTVPATTPAPEANGKTVVAYVGEVGFQDGVDCLLRALRHLICVEQRRGFMCVVVGGGDALNEMKHLARDLGIQEDVRFIGRVAHSEVGDWLAIADICVAPEPSNPYNDRTTVVKMMEYMAAGKAIVAFDLPEHRATADNGAIYACPNDEIDLAAKIALLMDNVEGRRKMGEMGRRRIQDGLAWSYQEKRLLQVYETLRSRPR
jgi:glycosyltransferase involved in cell wall biosynthesis